ncbi:HlyD family secretion protein [Moheibacter sp.]|uniref:HlyD family secretion protein n=1 Tax=Moheibacter sp. TaxID=1965316 RepID=UPI003C730516
MKKIVFVTGVLLSLTACKKEAKMDQLIQGKVEREEIAVVGKIAGRIDQILVQEGDFVQKGDTLAILNIPEVDAKKAQAQGAVKSAEAQYDMSVNGATRNQLQQLNAKRAGLMEQYNYAKKSLDRLSVMVKDSLIPQQQYDEVYAKYQGAHAQLVAVDAEIADVKNGARIEQQIMAQGQQDRALGALEEVRVAEKERYITAPQDMQVDLITLKLGELAMPGYTLFKGTLKETTFFRFTVPETELKNYPKGGQIDIHIPYLNKDIKGEIKNIKPIGAYANIATAYPDYDAQDPLYEMTVRPVNQSEADEILSKTTVTLKK